MNLHAEIVPERVLSGYLKRTAVELAVGIKIFAYLFKVRNMIRSVANLAELRVEYPVDKIIFVAEMIIKALAVHPAFFTYVSDAYLRQGLGLHQFLE